MEKTKRKKKIGLITKHVFIDTSIYEEENFFHGNKIQSLFNYAKIGIIQLHMTTISKMELLNRFSKQLTSCKSEMKRVYKSFNEREIRIIKNLSIYENFSVPTIKKESHYGELERKLTTNIQKSNINIIPSTGIDIDKVFRDYFYSKPPFGQGQKKDEFPDAFIIGALEVWCEKNKSKMYVLSKDNDFLTYKSKNLIMTDNTEEFLSKISEYYDKEFALKRSNIIKRSVENEIDNLISYIEEEISDKIIVKTENNIYTAFSIESLKFIKYNILSIRDSFSEVELLFKTSISFAIFPEIRDFGENFFEENLKPKKITVSADIPVDIEVEKNGKIRVKWINSGNEIVIEYKKE